MLYGSICSGIEAATVAWHELGWKPAFFSEIDKFPSTVLAHHWPNVPNLGDFRNIQENSYAGTTNLLVGGTPCQDFSIAGPRTGLDGNRGRLSLEFLHLVDRIHPKWVVWENVFGLLSSNKGRDFGAFLQALGDRGYGFAYRILNAQYFGVPQRRRRVFVVGYLGDWRPPAAVLFEPEGSRRDPSPRKKAATGVARCLAASTGGSSGKGQQHTFIGSCGPLNPQDVVSTLDASYGRLQGCSGQDLNHGHSHLVHVSRISRALTACKTATGRLDPNEQKFIGFHSRQDPIDAPVSLPLEAKAGQCVAGPLSDKDMVVRRLTPLECERLQGFPDHYTMVPWGKKNAEDCPDGHRYRALGNSMAVPCMRWIGERIQTVDERYCEKK